jgi:iron(III) transport system substrate-binding protein
MRTVFAYRLARAVAADGSPDAGFAWLGRLDAATKEYVANPALLFEKLVRGEGEVTVWELTDVRLHQASGAPIGYAFPASGTPVIDDAVALVAGAPQRAAAVAFLDWVGSAQAQTLAAERAFRLPARADLAPDRLPAWAREALSRLIVADYDEALASEQGPAWMARWDSQVRGHGAAGAVR